MKTSGIRKSFTKKTTVSHHCSNGWALEEGREGSKANEERSSGDRENGRGSRGKRKKKVESGPPWVNLKFIQVCLQLRKTIEGEAVIEDGWMGGWMDINGWARQTSAINVGIALCFPSNVHFKTKAPSPKWCFLGHSFKGILGGRPTSKPPGGHLQKHCRLPTDALQFFFRFRWSALLLRPPPPTL